MFQHFLGLAVLLTNVFRSLYEHRNRVGITGFQCFFQQLALLVELFEVTAFFLVFRALHFEVADLLAH